MTIEETAQFVGALIAATVAGFVVADARRRGLPLRVAVGWGLGVFCALIFFLPAYLWLRNRTPAGKVETPIAQKPCPYCEYLNVANATYCGKCGRQLKSSTEIHK
ncbi:MAG TPA: zinc ribbon domain-containing protein [Abditibacterium sp.]